MSKLLANQIANYGDNAPIEIKEGLSIPTGKPLQVAGTNGTSGQLLSSTGTSVQWIDGFDGDYTSLTNKPSIPSAQVQSDWNAVGTVAEILNKPVIPPQSTVSTVAASGGGSLSYTPANGQFTFAPADLTGFLTSTDITSSDIANWDAAYGWGNHAAVGYLTGEIDTLDSVTTRSNDTQNSITVGGLTVSNDGGPNGSLQIIDNGAYSQINWYDSLGNPGANIQGVSTNIYMNVGGGHVRVGGQGTLFYGDGNIELNKTTPVNSTTTFYNGFTIAGGTVSGINIGDLDDIDLTVAPQDGQVLKWDSENSSWKPANDLTGDAESGLGLGDLSVSVQAAGSANLSYSDVTGVFTYTPPDLSGYLTTETDPVFAASPASGIILQNITNWNEAYGWGDHSTEGYLTAEADTLQTVTARGATTNQTLRVNNSGGNQVFNINSSTGRLTVGSTSLSIAAGITMYHGNTLSTPTLTMNAQGGTITCSGDITTSGKIFYSNNFADLVSLPSATDYHGMFAHVHAEGHGYFAHGGAWTQLLDTGSSVNDLADVVITSPANGNVLKYENGNWINTPQTGGAANVTISDTAPGLPNAGDLWWESDKGRLKVYYSDTDSSQWVDASPPLSPTNISETTTNGSNRIGVTDLTSQVSQANEGSIEFQTDNGTTSAVRWVITPNGSLVPAANASYDIGTAEYKVRDLYLDSGSIHTPSEKNLSFYDGNLTWGGDDVIMLQDLKDMMATATSFEDFKNAIMGL
jgi:hypothetical protein